MRTEFEVKESIWVIDYTLRHAPPDPEALDDLVSQLHDLKEELAEIRRLNSLSPFARMQALGWEYAGEHDPMMSGRSVVGPQVEIFGHWFEVGGETLFRPASLPGSPYASKSLWRRK